MGSKDPVIFFLWFQPNNAMYEESHKWFMPIDSVAVYESGCHCDHHSYNRQNIIPRGLLTTENYKWHLQVPQVWKVGSVHSIDRFKKKKKVIDECLGSTVTVLFIALGFMVCSLLKIHCKLPRPFCYMIRITNFHSNLCNKNRALGMLVLQKTIAFKMYVCI